MGGLRYGIISDAKKEQCRSLTFRGKDLEKLIYLVNGTFVDNFKIDQLIVFWINYFNRFHLQNRKYWQFLKLKECFCLIQKKEHLTQVGLIKIESLQTALRNISILESYRQIQIPLSTITKRFSLTDLEMDLIDTPLKEKKPTYVAIAKKIGVFLAA